MLVNDLGHVALERIYSDPSAAHERALVFGRYAYRVTVEPSNGSFIVTAWFYDEKLLHKALN
jgi:hypothetical protein